MKESEHVHLVTVSRRLEPWPFTHQPAGLTFSARASLNHDDRNQLIPTGIGRR